MKIPRLIIAATQSGSGKTTIVCGLLAALKERGLDVQAFKVGPDYIDTGYHEIASGKPSHNLDSWLVGAEKLQEIFFKAARESRIAVIEGVMGLYDGGVEGVSSTAQISALVKSPVILVIDAKSMGVSAAAIALGFREFDRSLNLAGVILNRLGSDSHAQMIIDALKKIGVKCFGAVKRSNDFVLPERHLGLVPTAENNFDVLEKICATVKEQIDIDALLEVAENAPPLDAEIPAVKNLETTCRIAVAHDAAFNFYYEESLSELENLGAEIVYFSPLADENLPPEIDGLIIGGGFPEMFAAKLEDNKKIRAVIRSAAAEGLPIFAECGGFMFLMEAIKDFSGKNFEMCGVIPRRAEMTGKLQMVGYVEASLLKDCVLGKAGEKIRAHEFHFSVENGAGNFAECRRLRTGKIYRAGFAEKNIAASYLHLHFAGSSRAAKNFVDACKNFRSSRL